MKKYKVHWSIFNLFSESQSEVVKLQQIVKGIMGAGVLATWAESNATYGILMALGAGVLDMILACFYFELIENKNP